MKKVGLAAFENTKALYDEVGQDLLKREAQQLETQLSVFQAALVYFAQQHGKEIRTNSTFRQEFARMCTAIGVDPLVGSSSNKQTGSLWTYLLGEDVNDFYFELGVKIIEICRATRNENGGLISLNEVQARLSTNGNYSSSSGSMKVTVDDIERSVQALERLGKGFELVKIAHRTMIRSVPSELNSDQSQVLEACEALGYVTKTMLRDNLRWSTERSQTAIDDLLSGGLIWIDSQASETKYWVPNYIN